MPVPEDFLEKGAPPPPAILKFVEATDTDGFWNINNGQNLIYTLAKENDTQEWEQQWFAGQQRINVPAEIATAKLPVSNANITETSDDANASLLHTPAFN